MSMLWGHGGRSKGKKEEINWSKMAWIMVSSIYLVTKGECEVGIVVASLDIVMFSLD